MKKTLEKFLALLARNILKKYKPKVIGITGSIGKTSAKEAIFAVLSSRFNVRKNIKNYNNELGLPLTIIGIETGGKSISKWLNVFFKAIKLLIIKEKKYPEILVLEMGADKPGDIGYLVELAPCYIGILTGVGPAHLKEFKTIENVLKEKKKILTHLNKDSVAIYNGDEKMFESIAENLKAKILTFGYNEKSDIKAVDLIHHGEGLNLKGIKFKILFEGSAVPVFLPNVVGAHQIYSALIASAVGLSLQMNLLEISQGLKNFKAPKGRMNLIEGNQTLIIDDTYNSSPKAVYAALDAVEKLQINEVKRKVAILGDMLDLGDYSIEAHEKLGQKVAEKNIDLLIAVGDFRQNILNGAQKAGMNSEKLISFENSIIASEKINELIESGDLILIKGSQGSRMERVVKALMKETDKAEELLVRFTKEWVS